MKQWGARSLGGCVVAAVTAVVLGRGIVQHGSSAAGLALAQQPASAHAMGSSPSSNPDGPKLVAITVDYPEEGSIFPPEITPPTFLWRDASNRASMWTIDVAFTDGWAGIRAQSAGERLRIGEIDPRCVSETNELPKQPPQQAAARTWIPDAATWEAIKRHSTQHPATITITGFQDEQLDHPVSRGAVVIQTSKDPVGAPIFYRDVPLMSNFGIALLQEKKLDEAIPYLQRSLELNPAYAKVYETIISSLDWPPSPPTAALRLEDVVRSKVEEGTAENASRQRRESLDAQYRQKLDAVLDYIMASGDAARPALMEEERRNPSSRPELQGVPRAPGASPGFAHLGEDRSEIENLIAELDIPRLRKRVEQEDKNSDESLAAQRQILRIFLHTFEVSNALLGQNRNAQALTCLEIAAQAAPMNPYIFYDLARAQALDGQPKKALSTLQAAVEKGFNRADRAEGDRAFEGLRSQADYQKALAKMRGGKPQPAATP